MKPQEHIRIHKARELVGIDFPGSIQLYLQPKDARALAKELIDFANASEKPGYWPNTRIVQDGQGYDVGGES